MRVGLAIIVLFASSCLLIRAARIGIAGDYLDPIARISAQDEAFFANSVIGMVEHGDSLTPRFMGRYSFYKPPLFMWLSAASARCFGISRFTLRFPLALLCAFAVGMVFLIGVRIRSWEAGAAAAILLISNHLWNVSGAMVLTDALLAACDISAIYWLFRDPSLKSSSAFCGLAASIGAAILTKTVAGVLPIVTLGLFWIASLPPPARGSWKRACAAIGAGVALAAPWFVYQLMVHRRWFWTEHVLQEILGFGRGTPPQTTSETHWEFYVKRLILLDPVLLLFLLIAIPALFMAVRARSPHALLTACWLAPMLAAPFAWHYRSATYLIPAAPPMALAAACYFPQGRRWSRALLVAAMAAFACKVALPRRPWGLAFSQSTIQPAAAPLADLCNMRRGNELISVGMEDDLYASVLPLARLRYALISESMTGGTFSLLDLTGMGISLTVDDFDHLEDHRPAYCRKLSEWNLNSEDAIGSLIVAADEDDLMQLVRSQPDGDFLFPTGYLPEIRKQNFPNHRIQPAGPRFFFLLSDTALPRTAPPGWTCRM